MVNTLTNEKRNMTGSDGQQLHQYQQSHLT